MNTAGFPENLAEFEERFATEEACCEFVRSQKWPEGFRCGKCGGRDSWAVPSRRLEECRGCRHQESLTAGALFHGTRKPLKVWFRAVTLWVVSKRGLSAKELSRQVGIHYETAWLWCHRFRACVGHAFGQEPLTGVVEMDEMHVGGTDDKAHKGRSLAGRKALVGGAVEVRDGAMGRVRLEHLSAADANQLEGFALRNIAASRWLLFVRILGAAVFSTPAMAQLTQRMGPT
jgi:hypothetical protein